MAANSGGGGAARLRPSRRITLLLLITLIAIASKGKENERSKFLDFQRQKVCSSFGSRKLRVERRLSVATANVPLGLPANVPLDLRPP